MNCVHVLPSLRELERSFADELVVVGVHSGKFIAERETENIRQAVLRLGIEHPVLNDRQYRTWRAYAVNAWPTLVLVDPAGYVVGQHAGEFTAERLAPAIRRVVAEAEARGTLDRRALTFPAEPLPATPLAFPQKLALDGRGAHLALADTGHHRVLLLHLDADARAAEVMAVAGSGEGGLRDGPLEDARFRRLHGVAFSGERVLVADTDNHALREIDLGAGEVRTLAGTGEQARRWPPRGGPAREVALNSPWDVLEHEGVVYVAMAGCHQVWRMLPGSGRIEPWLGSGAEALHDGSAASAALAQPSGLATDGVRLYFADSESSAIRWAELADGQTGTIVGTGLFDFGDRDGVGQQARLQHPLGVALHGTELLVADTYNDALKRIDPRTRTATTWLSGDAGVLHEPGGIAVAGGRAFVADSNHQRVLVAEPADGAHWELSIRGL
ncbi:MAG TPA: thioredoxin-like domain-containing protein [Longimicrobiales bacterium]